MIACNQNTQERAKAVRPGCVPSDHDTYESIVHNVFPDQAGPAQYRHIRTDATHSLPARDARPRFEFAPPRRRSLRLWRQAQNLRIS